MARLLLVAVAALAMLGACSSDDPAAAQVAKYCATVARTADAMAGTDPAAKRPAMAELRDAAPAEIRDDWDVVFELEAGDPAARDVARNNVANFEAQHC